MFSVTLPEYEKAILKQYTDDDPDKFVFMDPTDTDMAPILEKIKESSAQDSVEHLGNMITYQLIEIKAFIEAFQGKARLEAKK